MLHNGCRHSPRTFRAVLLALVLAIFAGTAAPASAEPSSFIRLQGYEGVSEQVFTDTNALLYRTIGSYNTQPSVFFALYQPETGNQWQVDLVPAFGAPLVPGVYTNAGGHEAFPLRPVMSIHHFGGWICYGGSFTINSIDPVTHDPTVVEYDVEWVQTCNGVPVSGRAVFVPPRDTAPPLIDVPEGGRVFRLATDPSGAVIDYLVTTRDADPNPRLECTPPAGSTFAIGETTVTCVATDAAGNSSSASFTIYVIGAEGQLVGLRDRVAEEPAAPGNVLLTKVEHALRDLRKGRPDKACQHLRTFVRQVEALGARLAGGPELIASAEQIRRLLTC